jgi:hypothetical protein
MIAKIKHATTKTRIGLVPSSSALDQFLRWSSAFEVVSNRRGRSAEVRFIALPCLNRLTRHHGGRRVSDSGHKQRARCAIAAAVAMLVGLRFLQSMATSMLRPGR